MFAADDALLTTALKPQEAGQFQPKPVMGTPNAPSDPTLPTVKSLETFELQIYNQVGLVYNGQVKAIASANDQGEFSILPGHTNFISLIKQPVMIYPQHGDPKKVEVKLGVLRCLYNKVEIFTGLLVSQESAALAEDLQALPKDVQPIQPGSELTSPQN